MTTDEQDGQLVQGAKQGSLDCFGQLYHRYYASMVALAYSLLADRHLSEDSAQEAFAVACRDLQNLRCNDKFAGWLAGICRNVAKQMLRTRKELISNDHTPAADDKSEGDGVSETIRRAVWQLAPADREVIVLRYYNDLSYEQIAAVLGISELAVHGRLVRSKRKIEKILRRNGLMKDHDEKITK
ncbi:MAG: sigma-70 family RNA polymerase sigma factor [Phycisphaerae bacterium]